MVGVLEPSNPVVNHNTTAGRLTDVLRGTNATAIYGDQATGHQPTAPGNGQRAANQVAGANAAAQLQQLGGNTPTERFQTDLESMVREFRQDLDNEAIQRVVQEHLDRHFTPEGCMPSSGKTLNKNAAAVIVSLQQAGFIEPNADTVRLNPEILSTLQNLDENFTGQATLTFDFSRGDVLFDNVTVTSDNTRVTVTVDVEDGNIKLGDPKDIESGLKVNLSDTENANNSTLKVKVGPLNFYIKKADVSLSEKGSLNAAVAGKGMKSAFAMSLVKMLGYTSQKMVELPGNQQQQPTISLSNLYSGYIANAQAEQIAAAGDAPEDATPFSTRLHGAMMTMEFNGQLPEDAVWQHDSIQPYLEGIDVSSTSVSGRPATILDQTGLAESHPRVAALLSSILAQVGPEEVALGWSAEQEPKVGINIHRLQDGSIDCDQSQITFEPPISIRVGNHSLNISSVDFVEKGEGAEQKVYAKLNLEYPLSATGYPRVDGAINAVASKVARGLLNFASSYMPLQLSESVSADGISGEINLIEGGVDIELSATQAAGENEGIQAEAQDTVAIMTLDSRGEGVIDVKVFVQVFDAQLTPPPAHD